MQTQVATEAAPLTMATVSMEDLNMRDSNVLKTMTTEPELEEKAEQFALQLIEPAAQDLDAQQKNIAAIENMGLGLQKKAASSSKMLQQPINNLKSQNEKGGGVADSLVDLKMQVEALDPAKFDFKAGFLARWFGWLPFIGTPLKKYFSQFESAQTIIDAVISSLEKGRDQLHRDNITLSEDQKRMREMTFSLEKQVQFGQELDTKLSYHLSRTVTDDKKKYVEEELLFTLRQRIQDLQQQLAVNQQGVMALEILVRNNKELVRGVNRALNVTVTALEVAVTVALALDNQKIVLDKINALNTTTNDLIAGTSNRLKTQGAEIQKMAASTNLDMEVLKNSFADINAAMDDINNFKREALPQMADAILEMDKITTTANESIVKMEKGNATQPSLMLDVA